jgi:hypothetical protein
MQRYFHILKLDTTKITTKQESQLKDIPVIYYAFCKMQAYKRACLIILVNGIILQTLYLAAIWFQWSS